MTTDITFSPRPVFLFIILFIANTFLLIGVDNSFAQIPKTAQPELFDKRFEKPVVPKSTLEPMFPEYKPDLPTSEIEAIKFVLSGVVVEGSTVYKDADFLPSYEKLLGKKISLGRIYDVAAAITTLYRNDGYLLTKAIVPSQRVRNGIVNIRVIEGFIDDVDISGKIGGRIERLRAYADNIIFSRPLRAKVLERYLLLIDDLPGVQVESVLTPSKSTPGAANLTLILKHQPIDGYASIDNRGSRFNGPIQGSIGGNLNSVLGLNERTGFNFITTDPTDELLYFSGSHEQIIGLEGTKISLSGSLSFTQPGDSLEAFNVEGESSTVSVQLFHPFIRSREQNLSGRVGFVRRNSTTDLLGSLSSRDRLRVFNAEVIYDFVDKLRGVNLVSLEFSQGADIFDATESGSANLSRAQGKSDFSKVYGKLRRQQYIASGLSVLVETVGQYAFDTVLASEEFGFGGSQFGRGYDSSEITGDQGVAVKAEIQYFYQVAKKYLNNVQPYVFYDYGSVWQKGNDFTGTDRQSSLSSAGAGVRFGFTNWLSGYVELAKPLDDKVTAEGNRDFRGFASLIARF